MRQGTWQSSGRSRSKSGLFGGKHHQSEAVGLIQYITVFLYIVVVSLPAASLAYYYTSVWNPNYVNKNLALSTLGRTNQTPFVDPKTLKCDCSSCPSLNKQSRDAKPKISLQKILVTSKPSN